MHGNAPASMPKNDVQVGVVLVCSWPEDPTLQPAGKGAASSAYLLYGPVNTPNPAQ